MFGRYCSLELSLEGAQSRIYKAVDRVTGKKCVLKAGKCIETEALLARELNHPYIVAPYDFGKDEVVGSYAAYEEITERPIHEMRHNPKSFRVLVLRVAEFLSFLHHRRWLYNDFKPEHFFAGEDGIKVIDLGLCSPLLPQENSQACPTFSGTFPYISPERLLGRPCDERSDIYALGILLLKMFLPNEQWEFAPSVSTLQEVQRRSRKLKGFWRKLLSEMTAFEPAQRLASAEELWRKLLPSSCHGTFLFFPVPGTFAPSEEVLRSNRVHIINSESRINLDYVENQEVLHAWKLGWTTVRFDLREVDVYESVFSLCQIIRNEKSSEFHEAVKILQRTQTDRITLIVLRNPEALTHKQRSLLWFLVSSLSQSRCFRFVVLTNHPIRESINKDWNYVELPPYSTLTLQETIQSIFPSWSSQERVQKFQIKSISIPEQIVFELQGKLNGLDQQGWPAAATQASYVASFEQLTVFEKRTLAGIAVAGGTLTMKQLESLNRGAEKNVAQLVQALNLKGYISVRQGRYLLTVPSVSILQRFRQHQIVEVANCLLRSLSKNDFHAVYSSAKTASKHRIAATAALRAARKALKNGSTDMAVDWFWKAFVAKADLPKSILYQLATTFIRHSEMERAEKMLRHIQRKIGSSFGLADLYMDLDHRRNDLKAAADRASQMIEIAKKKKKPIAGLYFTVRFAGFCILNKQVATGEKILLRVQRSNSLKSTPRTAGLIHHFLGLANLFRGKLDDAISLFTKAIKSPHRFRSSSLMNLAVAYGQLREFAKANKFLRRSIRLFTHYEDADRLSYAYNNLGVLLKEAGQFKEALQSHYWSVHLSSASKNEYILSAAYENLAITYALEGRTDLSIYFGRRAASVAKKAGLEELSASSLTNCGFHFAIKGDHKKAISWLKRAAKIRKRLGLRMNLAGTYEYLGLTYLFVKHYRKSKRYLELARELFSKSGAEIDLLRTKFYLALVSCRAGKPNGHETTVEWDERLNTQIFERGLYYYVLASSIASSTEFDFQECIRVIHEAELAFRKAHSLYWLGKVLQMKAECHIKSDRYESAMVSLESACNIFSGLGARQELRELSKGEIIMKLPGNFLDRLAEKLPYKILLMIKDLLREQNLSKMITKILDASLKFTNMERAVLILQEEPLRVFKSVSLDETAIKEICEISRSATMAATEQRDLFICSDAAADVLFKNKPSIVANRIMSIVCLPLEAEGKLIGFLYLDSREGLESLASTEKVLLEIFASIIAIALNNSMILERSLEEIKQLQASFGLRPDFPEIVAGSKSMLEILKTVRLMAVNDLPVLITGETGTGKELIARVLHYSGKRKDGRFVAVNASALAETLLESELFGHEKGSFTGATALRKGVFEEAQNGTLFLDEIGEMSKSVQIKFLRVLQEREFRRVGGHDTLHTNARIVVATNRNLLEMVKEKQFRDDLFYRIATAHIHLPPLRERQEDIPLLASFFLKSAITAARKKIRGFSPDALELIKIYPWPGNVRQLKTEIDRIVALADSQWVEIADFSKQIKEWNKTKEIIPDGHLTLREMERSFILERLKTHGWNVFLTAQSLGVTRNGLYSKMKLYGIPKKPALVNA